VAEKKKPRNSEIQMNNKKLKRFSLINLFVGYMMIFFFIILVSLNRHQEVIVEEVAAANKVEYVDDLFNGVHKDELVRERFYIDGHPVDRLVRKGITTVGSPNTTVVRDRDLINREKDLIITDFNNETYVERYRVGSRHSADAVRDVHNIRGGSYVDDKRDFTGRTILDERLAGLHDDYREGVVDINALDKAILSDRAKEEFDIGDEELTNLTLARDGEGDFDLDISALKDGATQGDLYAYNFPSLGVGAGIGSSAVGAGIGAAGMGAGIGEAVLDGKTVAALGGVGSTSLIIPFLPPYLDPLADSPPRCTAENDKDRDGLPLDYENQIGTDPLNADTDGDGVQDGAELAGYSHPLNPSSTPANPQAGGVGGLSSGAGAGGAAGLVTGTVTKKLGLGIGKGCAEHGGECNGHHGAGSEAYNHDHLPKDGALHIMIHVDGSGSILHTRTQLDIMRFTLLKDALLPYYNNDESLYERRVTIVDGNGERTLQFFTEATKKDNVLALVFQDEAAPAYHLPNFNKRPENFYLDDLNQLKSSLQGYNGLYRGVMFQVDRGKTFAKSFKEFVECAWQGKGYLENANLQKYYWQGNQNHITHKDGVVFSDVYHAKDSGDPRYYLDLIFEASRKVGMDLDIYGGSLKDGRQTSD
jgi:hypothetical protein